MFHENEEFGGDKKFGLSLLGKLENRFKQKIVKFIPKQIETYHLTLSTLLWCGLILLFSYLTKENIHWMWLTSLMIVMQYLTDLLDGELGRQRNTGLILWGYYMDHFLDYIFLCSILIGYSFIFNDKFNSLFFILVIFGSYIVNSYLSFAVTNKFKIEYLKIGPTEIRLLFIIINTLLIIFHKTYLVWLLPFVLTFSAIGLIYVIYMTQKEIWGKDMENKRIKFEK